MPYIVFDIETVPDNTMWQPSTPTKGTRARKKDQFAPLYAHRPIVIGYGVFDDNLVCGGIAAVASDDEVALIKNFTEWLAQQDATLVTFNGRGFDIPVLALRALRHGIPQHYNTAAHRKRYTEEKHIDLLEVTTDFGTIGRDGFSLDTLVQVIGLGGKNGVDGSMVEGMYKRGEIEKIRGYCACDVGREAFLFLRYQLMRGRVTIEQYRVAAQALFTMCVDLGLSGVTFGADQQRLLLHEPTVLPPPSLNGTQPAATA